MYEDISLYHGAIITVFSESLRVSLMINAQVMAISVDGSTGGFYLAPEFVSLVDVETTCAG